MSTLKEILEFKDTDGCLSVKLVPCGFCSNFRWYDYALHVDDGKGFGELSFNQYGAIIDCKHYEYNDRNGSMFLSEFKERFEKLIRELVPKDVFDKYLIALDMGKEGIFPEADEKEVLEEMFGLKDMRLSYLER